jgi:hypothetical protein
MPRFFYPEEFLQEISKPSQHIPISGDAVGYCERSAANLHGQTLLDFPSHGFGVDRVLARMSTPLNIITTRKSLAQKMSWIQKSSTNKLEIRDPFDSVDVWKRNAAILCTREIPGGLNVLTQEFHPDANRPKMEFG